MKFCCHKNKQQTKSNMDKKHVKEVTEPKSHLEKLSIPQKLDEEASLKEFTEPKPTYFMSITKKDNSKVDIFNCHRKRLVESLAIIIGILKFHGFCLIHPETCLTIHCLQL